VFLLPVRLQSPETGSSCAAAERPEAFRHGAGPYLPRKLQHWNWPGQLGSQLGLRVLLGRRVPAKARASGEDFTSVRVLSNPHQNGRAPQENLLLQERIYSLR